MSFHVGQRVVCVDDDFTDNRGSVLPANLPVKDRVYTIREFVKARGGRTFLRLVEIVNPLQDFFADGGPMEAAFGLDRFRPLVERKTDISVFTEMLKRWEVPA